MPVELIRDNNNAVKVRTSKGGCNVFVHQLGKEWSSTMVIKGSMIPEGDKVITTPIEALAEELERIVTELKEYIDG